TSYGSSSTLNTALVTSHSVSLTGLLASTTYHYRVKSRDAAGNLQTSGDFTFTTRSAITATAANNQLVVQGTAFDDNITIDQQGSDVRILDHGNIEYVFPAGSMTSAQVSGADGNDTITIDPSLGTLPITLLGEAGDDQLIGGSGND